MADTPPPPPSPPTSERRWAEERIGESMSTRLARQRQERSKARELPLRVSTKQLLEPAPPVGQLIPGEFSGMLRATSGHSVHVLLLRKDGTFLMDNFDDSDQTYIRGKGRVLDVVEANVYEEQIQIEFELRLAGDFAVGVLEGARLPDGFAVTPTRQQSPRVASDATVWRDDSAAAAHDRVLIAMARADVRQVVVKEASGQPVHLELRKAQYSWRYRFELGVDFDCAPPVSRMAMRRRVMELLASEPQEEQAAVDATMDAPGWPFDSTL